MNKSTFTAELRIKALIDDAQKELNSFGNSLKNAWANGNPPKSMLRTYEEMRVRLESLKQLAKKGVVDTSDLRQAENDYKAFQKDIHNLSVEFRLFTEEQKRAMLSTEEQANLKARAEAVRQYSEALKKNQEILKKREPLEKQKEDIKRSQAPERALATTRIADSEPRLKKLKERGPAVSTLSPEAQAYAKTLERQSALLLQIEQAQKRVNALKNKGLKEGGKNQLTEAKNELEKLLKQQEVFSSMAGKGEYDAAIKAYNDEIASLELTISSATETIATLDSAFEDIDTQLEKLPLQDTEKELEKLKERLKELGVEGVEDAKDFGTLQKKVQELESQALSRVDGSIKGLTKSLSLMGEESKEVGREIDQTTQAIKQQEEAASQRKAFEDKIKQFLGLSGAAQVLRSALRDALQTITELDATMTEMAVVTDLTVGDYWNQLPEYSKQASDLGVSINSAYKAATLYYQQGLKGNEVTKISAQTLKMAKVAGLDAADATDKMTAALRGFNMEMNETSAQKVADVYSELAAITAADVDEISSAMTKTASIAHSAGMEFETTAAFLSQIIETTRESAETAGTAMKTVIARFQELKKNPNEIGEVDGEIVDANAIETALRSVGVALRDSSGQFRELDDVFLELSSKWDGLDKNTQRYIATIAAGSRQQSRFIAMMSDYGRTQELVTAANNSAGASQRQFEKTTESLEYKIEKLKNAWHEFTMGIMDSDLVKFGVDALSKFLEIVNKVTSGIEGFGGGLTKVMSVLTIFKMGTKIFEKIKQPLITFFADIVKQAGVAGEKSGQAYKEGVGKSAKAGGTTQEGQSQQQKPAGKIGAASSTGFKGKVTQMGIGVMEAAGVGHFADAYSAHKEVKAAKTIVGGKKKDVLAKKEEYLSNKQALKEKTEQYTIHKNGQVSKKGHRGFVSKEEAEQAKEEISKLTDETKKYEEASESLQKNSGKVWSSISDGIGNASSALMGIGLGLGAVGSAFESLGMEEVAEGFNKASQIFSTTGAILGIIPPILTLIQTLFPGVGAASAAAGGVATTAGATASAAWGVVGLIVMIVIAAIVVALAVILIVMAAIKNASPEKKLEDTKKAAEEATKAANEASEAYKELANSLEELDGKYKALEDLTKGTKEWNKAVMEINSSVMDLIGKYPELAAFVENDGGLLKLDVESDAVQGVLNQAYERTITSANNALQAKLAVNDAQTEVDRKNLDKDVRFTYDGYTYNQETGQYHIKSTGEVDTSTTYESFQLDNSQIDALAKGIASGATIDLESDAGKDLLKEMNITKEQFEILSESIKDDEDSIRSYGDSLIQRELQEEAAYDSMASSVVSLVDTMGMAEARIDQMFNLADGEVYEEAYNEMDKMLEDADLVQGDSGETWGESFEKATGGKYDETYVEQALSEAGYKDAKLEEDGKVSYTDKDGIRQSTDLDQDTIVRAVNTYYAKTTVKDQAENMDSYLSGMSSKLAETEDSSTMAALERALQNEEGVELTNADIEALGKLTEDEVKTAFESLPKHMQEIYGSSDKYWQEIQSAKTKGNDTLNKTTTELNDMGLDTFGFMTAGVQKAYTENMKNVYSKTGGTENVVAVQTAMNDIFSKAKNDQERTEMSQMINATDWSNQEALLGLQLDLEKQFGLTEEEASTFVTTLGDASYAVSNLSTTVQAYGELWKATEKVNQSVERLTSLQWKYDKAIKNNSDNIDELINSMVSEYSFQAEQYKASYDAASDNLARIYASGGTDYKTDLTDYVTLGQHGVEVDDSRLQQAINAGDVTKEDVDEWLGRINEQYSVQSDSLQGMRDSLDAIEELEEQGREAYYELRDMAKEAVVAALEEQINLQQQTLDATKDANSQLISKIQEQINESRQQREREKAEKNIADLRNQQAYLAMDTSGTNALQLAQMDQSIADAEQDYTDSLIDQSIQKLQDANDKAAEQRERQISIAENQLEAYQNSAEFQREIDYQLNDMIAAGNDWQQTQLGGVIEEYFTKGMSSEEATKWANEIGSSVKLADAWKEGTAWTAHKNAVEGYIDGIETNLANLPGDIAEAADTYKKQKKVTELTGAGFNQEKLNELEEEDLDKLLSFSQAEDSGGSTAGNVSKLATTNASFQTKQEYYDANMEKILNGESVKSYEDYVKDTLVSERNKVFNDSQLVGAINNNRNGAKAMSQTQEYKDKLSRYEELGGSKADFDKNLAEKITGGSIDGVGAKTSSIQENGGYAGQYDEIDITVDGTAYTVGVAHYKDGNNNNYGRDARVGQGNGTDKALDTIVGGTPEHGWVAMYNSKPYVYIKGKGRDNWFKIADDQGDYSSFKEAYLKNLRKYKSGGLADFTGPAWLDGTRSRPEYVLNADQTERFFSLIDVLEKYDADDTKKSSGDNYFEIAINVEKLENDYDVEQVANKIRKMIYEDAMYRNVNAINNMR